MQRTGCSPTRCVLRAVCRVCPFRVACQVFVVRYIQPYWEAVVQGDPEPGCVLLVVSPYNDPTEARLLVLPAAHSPPTSLILEHLAMPSGLVAAAESVPAALAVESLGLFDPLPLPSHVDDWLAQYREAPQSVADLLSRAGPHAAARAQGRNVIYLQPISCEHAASTSAAECGVTDGGGRPRGPTAEADDSDAALFNALQRYLAAFFHGTPVKLLDPLVVRVSGRRGALLGKEVRWRDFCPGSGQPLPHGQLKAGMLLAALETAGLPEDGFCVLGVTMTDLFIGDDDVFTAGLASCRKRAGCFSFYRYREGAGSDAGVLLHRACKTASHELLHLFGIGHCLHRRCLMNGTGHLREDFAAPPELCPVDLAKLKAVLGRHCELVPRYHALLGFCEAQPTGFGEQAAWLRRAIAAVDKAGTAGEVIVARAIDARDDDAQAGPGRSTQRQLAVLASCASVPVNERQPETPVLAEHTRKRRRP